MLMLVDGEQFHAAVLRLGGGRRGLLPADRFCTRARPQSSPALRHSWSIGIGDFGFVLGMRALLYYTGSLDYQNAFAAAPIIAGKTWCCSRPRLSSADGGCICLFVGAWASRRRYPARLAADSMEGPTPISALIHAATMVTAGIFMVARMSPLSSTPQPRCRSSW